MNKELYRFHVTPLLPAEDLEDTLLLSLLATESLHGRSRVKLDVRVAHDKAKGICEIDASTPVGSDLARIFTGYATREWGESAVRVERLVRNSAAKSTPDPHRCAAAAGGAR